MRKPVPPCATSVFYEKRTCIHTIVITDKHPHGGGGIRIDSRVCNRIRIGNRVCNHIRIRSRAFNLDNIIIYSRDDDEYTWRC
jgi:hypothetical protein